MTMEVIQHIELGTAATSIDFNSIPTTFDDLQVVYSLRGVGSSAGAVTISMGVLLNGSGGTTRRLSGNGSSASSGSLSGDLYPGEFPGTTATSSTFSNGSFYVPNYRSAVAKSISFDNVLENNATEAQQNISAGLSTTTSAVTSITLRTYGAASNVSFAQGSSATLYGIKRYNTTLSPKATGGAISYDSVNNKWVHAFYTSGTFTPTENLTGVEYLVIAGGGGGGFQYGGGGGAGGYRSSVVGESSGGGGSAESTLSLTSGVGQTVTIGAGGAGATSTGAQGVNGSNSVFGSITATGGGGGGCVSSSFATGVAGGSGGAGAGGLATAPAGGAGTTNQGYAGGSGSTDNATYRSGGGGGGAGSVGANATTSGGNGGSGVTSSITGTAVARAGGGGGGAFSVAGTASAGGGAGTINGGSGSVRGTANTGGGGGGGSGTAEAGAAGGSGLVIIRYSA